MPLKNKNPSIFLDVDPSIIEKNMTIVKDTTLEDDLKNLFPSPSTNVSIVQPLPGMCIKTKIPDKNKKIFINICHTDAIPPPEEISENELVEILSSDEPSNYRMPMSIGEARIEKDKSGQPSTVYDVAINSVFFEKVQNSQVFHTFFVNVVFEGLQNKYGFLLDMLDFVILKNRKCFGSLQTHKIQKRLVTNSTNKSDAFKPLIEVVGSVNTEIPKKPIETKPEKKVTNEMDYQLIREPATGKIEYLVAEFKINDQLCADDILLDIGEDRIIVETPKTNQLTDIFVPFTIKQNSARSILNMNNHVLLITMAADDP